MANLINNNPDLLYIRSREDLLQFSDSRLNSLLQAVANFYTTRNDQSTWGNFLRALADELATLDYDYAYDIVNKSPSFLTPTDIRRRWAAPLYVSSNWPSQGQFDLAFKAMLVELIAAYQQGTTVAAIQDVIYAYTGIDIQVQELYKQIGNGVYDQSDRNSLLVSVNVGNAGSNPLTTITSLAQLQTIIQSLYTAIDIAKPAHVGLEFTTVFSEGEQLDCILSPTYLTQQQYITMTQGVQAYYVKTGYVPTNPPLFWLGNTTYLLNSLVLDSNQNFQLVTGSTGLGETGVTVPVWNTLSEGTTNDNQLTWTNISPAVTSIEIQNNIVTVSLNFSAPLSLGNIVTLINLGYATFLNGVALTVLSVTGNTFTAAYNYINSPPNYGPTTETQGTATFVFPPVITATQWLALPLQWQALYQLQYTNENCQSTGINDILRIYVRQVETPPWGPMLIQAPVLDPANPSTTIAAYGRLLSPTLTPSAWSILPNIFVDVTSAYSDGMNATYTYIPRTQFLHDGEQLTITGFTNPALNVTARIHKVTNLVANVTGVNITTMGSPPVSTLTVSTDSNFLYPGAIVNFANTAESFLNDTEVVVLTASPTGFTAIAPLSAPTSYINSADTGTAEVTSFQIPLAQVIALETQDGTSAGLVTPTLQSAYYYSDGNYILGQAPINTTGAGQGESWNPGESVFIGQLIVDSNGYTQIALNSGTTNSVSPIWSTELDATTEDNGGGGFDLVRLPHPIITSQGVTWQNLGMSTLSDPKNWVGILNFNVEIIPPALVPFTGEVGNWDILHLYGLVAPRLSQTWEISGDPQDQDFIFGLF
jgi:hypothetical protein